MSAVRGAGERLKEEQTHRGSGEGKNGWSLKSGVLSTGLSNRLSVRPSTIHPLDTYWTPTVYQPCSRSSGYGGEQGTFLPSQSSHITAMETSGP